ncbi:hypothetical protein SAMN02745165_01657 [Malonomonas rubra DSM 5091]|uniref:Uncharacterized protein n=1 Tax=Malonomonas rubra DSM 5091 TaxID=1122189 RepID=A0A1M6H208_MALRU|nr:hypothetical protein SAMN02745165_01657 [Malonomonas rubra DSM 5091]
MSDKKEKKKFLIPEWISIAKKEELIKSMTLSMGFAPDFIVADWTLRKFRFPGDGFQTPHGVYKNYSLHRKYLSIPSLLKTRLFNLTSQSVILINLIDIWRVKFNHNCKIIIDYLYIKNAASKVIQGVYFLCS